MEHPVPTEAPLSTHELLGVTRTLLSSARLYAEAVSVDNPSVFEAAIDEGIKKFRKLASPQLPGWVIHNRLGLEDATFDLGITLDAIDAELSAWQAGGLVTSQVEPLEDFTAWLYSLHTLESLEFIEDRTTRQIIERRIGRAARALQ